MAIRRIFEQHTQAQTSKSVATARFALAALLLTAPAFASAAQVVPPPESTVWAQRDGWSFAVRDPETSTNAFLDFVNKEPSVDALITDMRTVYADRLFGINPDKRQVRVTDTHRMWPMLASEYADWSAYRFGTRSLMVIPDFSELDDVPAASDETQALAEHPIGVVHAIPQEDGHPRLVCDIQGAVSMSYWRATAGSLRGRRTVPVEGAKVVLTEETLEHDELIAEHDPRVGSTYTTHTDAAGRYQFRMEMQPNGWASSNDKIIPYGWDNRRFVETVVSNGQVVNPVPKYRNAQEVGPMPDGSYGIVPYPQRKHETRINCVLTPETLRPPHGQSRGPAPGVVGACFPNGCFPGI